MLIIWLLSVGVVTFVGRDSWYEVEEGEVELEGAVLEVVDQTGMRQTFRMSSAGYPKRVQVASGGFPRVLVGDVVALKCKVRGVQSVSVESFRYDRYLMKEGISALCYGYSSPRVVGRQETVRSRLLHVRGGFESVLERHLVEPNASLLEGLLYGARSTLPKDIMEQFRRSGTMHIVAVSGYNVMVVATIVMHMLTMFWLRRGQAFYFVLLGILLFVLVTGGDPSVVRAAIMGGLVLVARNIGRPRAAITLFLIAATLMTMANPRVLLFDAGFHLSFAAAMGLVWLSPYVKKVLPFVTERLGIRSVLTETLAAVIATMPIMILHFKQFSLVAPIANLFIVPLVPIAMGLGFLGTLIAIFFEFIGIPFMGTVALVPAYVLLEVILRLIEVFSALPFINYA